MYWHVCISNAATAATVALATVQSVGGKDCVRVIASVYAWRRALTARGHGSSALLNAASAAIAASSAATLHLPPIRRSLTILHATDDYQLHCPWQHE